MRENKIKRNILLNPGPATTTDTVKWSQVVPDICPREEQFGQVMEEVSTELARLVGDPERYAAVLFGGSGTAAVEAMLTSVVYDGTVLILNNGAYGKRMCEIAEAYEIPYIEFESVPDDAPDLAALEKAIRSSVQPVSHLAVVHHETTTGLLNDVKAIGELCARYGIEPLVDAMSSYAAVPIDMTEMNISFLVSSSNKNVQGMPGVSFVIADKGKLERLKHTKPRNYYLNLYAQYQFFKESRQMRFTPPVQTIYALRQALEELKLEGVSGRYARYAKSWDTLIKGISRLGLTHLVPEACHSKIITSIVEPDCPRFDFREMHDYFYRRNMMIYPGKVGSMRTFRIANIGDITYKDIETFIVLLEQYLASIGYGPGRGEEAHVNGKE
ncbi:2-aminoethylphosphonate--pyruvate transaminase [Paenibacillus sp. P26]|nr:2-aminoethylphosphonate--pyruvate transaminase [Paenibacillus sp. P26]UUZ94726.1 2-aminoethylphosphonate--pyruvate transaminase [Paenibacillus sp. P25]